MQFFSFRFFKHVIFTFCIVLSMQTNSVAQTTFEVIGATPAKESALFKLIGELSTFKTLSKKAELLDGIVAQYCTKKLRLDRSQYGIDAEYGCEPTTGVKNVKYHSTEIPEKRNYLMYIVVSFNYQDFTKVKQFLIKKMGKPNSAYKNYIAWENKTDKFLNEFGNPVISVSRDIQHNTATFGVALEQGDSEEN